MPQFPNNLPYFPREGDSRGVALGYDIFWPGDPAEDHTKVELPGNYISVLNGFLPGLTFEAASTFYSFSQQENVSAGTLASPLNVGRVIPIEAGMRKFVKDGFSHLYRTRLTQVLQISNTAQFTFQYLKYESTPIIVAIGQDTFDAVRSDMFANDFRYFCNSQMPTTAGSAIIDVYHGWADIVQVAVNITTAANALNVIISQMDEVNNAFQEFNVWPSAFPYYTLFDLPQKNSRLVRVNVAGGGAGETSLLSIVFVLRRRVG